MLITRHTKVLLALLLSIAGLPLAAADELIISRLSGSVEITTKGKAIATQLGAKVASPLKVVTGADGSLRLEHDSAALDIGPNSVVILPKSSSSTLDKIEQQIGRVLYSVKPRKTRPLVVETPYLVSVVKGTTFSIAVENETATIALLEGSLLISGNGVDEEVLLAPNQKATRAHGERVISVTSVETAPPPSPPQANTAAPVPASQPLDPVIFASDTSIASDLADITAAYAGRATPAPQPPPTIPPPPAPEPPAPMPEPEPTPEVPAPDPEPAPQPEPQPEPQPIPGEDDDRDDDDNSGPGNSDDDDDDNSGPGNSDDDGNNGHGDDDDDDDDGNPAVTPTLPPVMP
jgi:outer membrane biosynthesis protein TonB